jgi:hypothetical protein
VAQEETFMQSLTRTKDVTVGLIGMAFGAVFLYQAYGMSYPSKVFPVAVCVMIILLNAVIVLREILWSRAIKNEVAAFLPSFRAIVVMVTAVVYVGLINFLGFYFSSFFCILFISMVTTNDPVTVRSLVVTVLADVVFLAVVYLVFSYTLNSTVPTGLFI